MLKSAPPKKKQKQKKSKTKVIAVASVPKLRSLEPGTSQGVTGMRNFIDMISTGTINLNGKQVPSTTFRGGQFLQTALYRSTGTCIFSDATGVPTSYIPLNPYVIGGLLYKELLPFQYFRFKQLQLSYLPRTATTTPGGVVLAYDPNPASMVEPKGSSIDEELGGTPNFFSQFLSLAATAAGPVWGPLVTTVGSMVQKAAQPLAESALKWFTNRKPDISSLDFEELIRNINNSASVEDDVTALLAYFSTFATANSLTLPTLPTLKTVVLTNNQKTKQLHDAIMQMTGAITNEFALVAQGAITGAVDQMRDAPGLESIGNVYMSYEVEACVVLPTDPPQLFSKVSNDPLDDWDNDPSHASFAPSGRLAYITRLVAALNEARSYDFDALAVAIEKRKKRLSAPVPQQVLRPPKEVLPYCPAVDDKPISDREISLRLANQHSYELAQSAQARITDLQKKFCDWTLA